MESLTWFFLESVIALGATLVVVMFILLVYWRRTLRVKPFLIGGALAVILLIVQAAVVTQRERADRMMRRIEAAVLESKPKGVEAELSERFHAEPPEMDRARFTELVKMYMEQVDVRTLHRLQLEMTEQQADHFIAELSYMADISARDFNGTVTSRWRLRFEHESEGWRIVNIIPIKLNTANIRGWEDLH